MGRPTYWLVLLVVNLLFSFQVIEAIESECSACQAIAVSYVAFCKYVNCLLNSNDLKAYTF